MAFSYTLVPGAQGPAGQDGASAYQIAVSNGFSGTQEEWLASLVGPTGSQGIPGEQGVAGETGPAGEPGLQGEQGIQGVPGEPGLPGSDGADALWNFTGAYNLGASYAVGDLATYDGKTWYRINSNGGNVGDTPAEGTFWTLIADAGAQGIQGIQGVQGEPGVAGETGPAGDPGLPGSDGQDGIDAATYVVKPGGVSPYFSSIQGAIDQAVTDGAGPGAPALILVEPGSYTEDVVITVGGVHVKGSSVSTSTSLYAATLIGSVTVALTTDDATNVVGWTGVDINNEGDTAIACTGTNFTKLYVTACKVYGGGAAAPVANFVNSYSASELHIRSVDFIGLTGSTTVLKTQTAKNIWRDFTSNALTGQVAVEINNSAAAGYTSMNIVETTGRITSTGSSQVTLSNAYVRGGTGYPVTHAGTGTLAMFNCYLESTAQQFMVNHTGAGLLYYGGVINWLSPLQSLPVSAQKLPGAPVGTTGPAGPTGPAGADGSNGLSAYEIALANGFVGTEVEWLASLQGADGTNGSNGVGVPVGGAAGQVLTKIDAVDYNTQWSDPIATFAGGIRIEVKNDSGVQMYAGQVVYVTGANGANVLVGLADASAEATSSKVLGLLSQDLAPNDIGYVINSGSLTGINTDAATVGDAVWLGTTPGGLLFGLANKPSAPDNLVYLGVVTRKNINNGEIEVMVQNGFELEELHDVAIDTIKPLVANDVLTYNGTLWQNSEPQYVKPTSDAFGSGVDGDVTITTNTTLTSIKQYNNLTVTNGAYLNTAGFPIFVRGTLTIDTGALVGRKGNDGSGQSAGGILSGGKLGTARAGGAGGSVGANGAVGGSHSNYTSFGGFGAQGGGNGSTFPSGASGGSSSAPRDVEEGGTSSLAHPDAGYRGYMVYNVSPTTLFQAGFGGGGGAGGTTGQTAVGGGGGGGGAVVSVIAHTIVVNGTGRITAKGGAGAAASGTGNAGGGGGGGGGVVIVQSAMEDPGSVIDISGGSGGAGVGTGSTGATGSAGTFRWQVM